MTSTMRIRRWAVRGSAAAFAAVALTAGSLQTSFVVDDTAVNTG